MSEANDELISAYVDEQLSERERASLEGRIQQEAALRQQVQVTRLTVNSAGQLAPLPLPRAFVLPNAMAVPEKPARASWDVRTLFRLGSAFAAALFVLLVGLDLSQMARPAAVALTPNALTTLAPALQAAAATQSTLSSQSTRMESKVENTVQAIAATGFTPQAAVINTMVAREMATGRPVTGGPAASSAASSSEADSSAPSGLPLLTATPAPAPMMTRSPTLAPLTPVPTLASVVAMPDTEASWPLTRLLAGATLIVGAVLAALGWRR
jgi:hypothetical protein